MNRFKLLFAALVLAVLSSCRDESLNPVPDYETAVHGWGRFQSTSARNFVFAEPGTSLSVDFRWNAIDGINKVSKIEFYQYFDESYVDAEGNNRLARHGGRFQDANAGGKLFKVVEGSAVPGNRSDISFSISQADIYNLYKEAKFKYDGSTEVAVFNNPAKPDRSPESPFVKGDQFELSWIIYTEDGRKFDYWSDSICSEEFPQSSCTVKFGVVCASDLAGELDYVQTEMVKGDGSGGGAAAPGTLTGTIAWTQEMGPAGPILGSYLTPDLSFGHYEAVWNDSPAYSASARVKDACNALSTAGTDQYSDTYTYNVLSVIGPKLTIRWNNTYGDAGTVELTRKDGRDWPPLK